MNQTSSIAQVFRERLLSIPDYQRGFAWEEQQLRDFWDDLQMLSESGEHYTGTVVLHPQPELERMDCDGMIHRMYHVVDGQQRLTTIVIFLDVLRLALHAHETRKTLAAGIHKQFAAVIDENGDALYKLQPNSDAREFFEKVILSDEPGVLAPSIQSHQRMLDAKLFFEEMFETQKVRMASDFEAWLMRTYRKVTQQLKVMVYEVSTTSEVGVVFETMNNRGKPLSELEKVKNYLLYAGAKLDLKNHGFDDQVNRTWTQVLEELMEADLVRPTEEDQLLRSHWLMAYNPDAKFWDGSRSIKQRFDLRHYRAHGQARDKTLLRELRGYIETLQYATTAFRDAYAPRKTQAFASFAQDEGLRQQIVHWSERIARIGVVAPFLPFLMAVRVRHAAEPEVYLRVLKLVEAFGFCVFKIAQKRANVGASFFYALGYKLFHKRVQIEQAEEEIRKRLKRYCKTQAFEDFWAKGPSHGDWYSWNGIKYTLYEYETHLAKSLGKSVQISWSKVAESKKQVSIEHILPQTATKRYWTGNFNKEEREIWTHDLGNLSLTEDNSSYGNKTFPEKRGEPGQTTPPCYLGSIFFMEREIAGWSDWSPQSVAERREKITQWARKRWSPEPPPTLMKAPPPDPIFVQAEDDEDEEAPASPPKRSSRGNKKFMRAIEERLNPMLSDFVTRRRLPEKKAFSEYAGKLIYARVIMPGADQVDLALQYEFTTGDSRSISLRFRPRTDTNFYARADAIRSYGKELLDSLSAEFEGSSYEAHGRGSLPIWDIPIPESVELKSAKALAELSLRIIQKVAGTVPFHV